MNQESTRGVVDRKDFEPLLDLRPALLAVHAGRWLVLGGALLGLAIGLAVWMTLPVEFSAVATVAVNQPRDAPAGAIASPTANYRALLENYSVAAAVIKSAGLDAGPSPINPERFMRRVLTVEEIRGTNLIRITVRLSDPALAAKVAQDVATRAVELSRSINEDEGTTLRARLQSQQEEALARFKAAEQRLVEFKRSSQIELLRADVDGLVRQRGLLAGVEVDLSSERGRAGAAEKEQSARHPTDTFRRTFADSPALTEAARSQSAGDSKALMGLGLETEEANPVYQRLDEEVALSRARVAELERMRQQILDSSAQFKNAGKLAEVYEKEIALAGLEADRLLARKVYEDVAQRYEQAKVVVTSGSAQLQIVDAAFTLPTPVSWHWGVMTALGALAGALVSLVGLLGTSLGRRQPIAD